jgi:hypothetical protein
MAVNGGGGGVHGLRSTCYSPWRLEVDGLLLSAWIVNPMAKRHNLAEPETLSDKAVAGSNFKEREDTEMSMGR